ncbi:MAG: hypothetical protein CM15mP25_0290 [Gammaproteobacteria bacterium]|nr:MAG: hypothetical protein CM15mP25_0290 [Gammaproteobacteria bacterium]
MPGGLHGGPPKAKRGLPLVTPLGPGNGKQSRRRGEAPKRFLANLVKFGPGQRKGTSRNIETVFTREGVHCCIPVSNFGGPNDFGKCSTHQGLPLAEGAKPPKPDSKFSPPVLENFFHPPNPKGFYLGPFRIHWARRCFFVDKDGPLGPPPPTQTLFLRRPKKPRPFWGGRPSSPPGVFHRSVGRNDSAISCSFGGFHSQISG